MRIVVTGGTGQVRRMLARHWHAAGHEVVVVGRNVRVLLQE